MSLLPPPSLAKQAGLQTEVTWFTVSETVYIFAISTIDDDDDNFVVNIQCKRTCHNLSTSGVNVVATTCPKADVTPKKLAHKYTKINVAMGFGVLSNLES